MPEAANQFDYSTITGKIKMDLWELPPIDPQKLNPANDIAESNDWLPGRDSNPRQGGYKLSSCFHEAWTISFP
ncbi:MAG: hypothetical protein C4526_09415 [Nitrospiraceae bacterium]|nr:MAG: hypothetical protein C4526_09415 [Nitrospiraceae bacterium]